MLNIDKELEMIQKELCSKEILSTIDYARIYNILDKYIINSLGLSILDIYEKSECPSDDVTRYVIMKLYENKRILDIIINLKLENIIPNMLYEMGNKKILMISDEVINNSNKRPQQMSLPTDEQQIKRIFDGLNNNYILYEKLYKDKIWLINSTNNNQEIDLQARIKMSPYMFFHLMGFDYKNLINPNKSIEGFANFSAIFPNTMQAQEALKNFGNQRNIYYIIEELLKNEDRFLNAALEGQLKGTINIDKLEMKSFSFERMGLIQTASGMVLFDKQKAINLGYGNTIQHINTDIILLNDFIRKYKIQNIFGLDFVFSPFDKIKGTQISDQQSVFITKQIGGGQNSGLLDGQTASISSSAVGYRENDFDFNISVQGEAGGEIIYPSSNPIEVHEFTEEERKKLAQTIIESIPSLNPEKLNEIVNENSKKK